MKKLLIAMSLSALLCFGTSAQAVELDEIIVAATVEVHGGDNDHFATIGLLNMFGEQVAVLKFHNSRSTIPGDALYFDANTGTVWSHYPAVRFSDVRAQVVGSEGLRMMYSDASSELSLQDSPKLGSW